MSDSVSFSYKTTKIGIVGSVFAAIIVASSMVIFGVNPNQPSENTDFGGFQYPATFAAMANGCGDIYRFEPEETEFGTLSEAFYEEKGENTRIPSHKMLIPVYGYMKEEPFPADAVRFYGLDELKDPIDKEQVLRTLYQEGIVMVWYSRDIEPSDLTSLRNYTEEHDNIMAAPWDIAGGVLPGNRNVAFTAWGISQSCGLFNEEILTEFITFEKENRTSRPEIIPEARYTIQGLPFPIR